MFWIVLVRSGPDKLGQIMISAPSHQAVLKAVANISKNGYLKEMGYPLNAEISLYDCVDLKRAAEELVKLNYNSPFTRAYHARISNKL